MAGIVLSSHNSKQNKPTFSSPNLMLALVHPCFSTPKVTFKIYISQILPWLKLFQGCLLTCAMGIHKTSPVTGVKVDYVRVN